MINQLGLYFDEDALYRDLILHLLYAVHDAATDIMFTMKANASEALSDDSAWFVDSVDTVKKHVLNGGVDFIVFYVGAQHWLAFLDNYGTGSKMDTTNNPFLSAYIESGLFNEARTSQGMTVLGRPAGDYQSPNFKEGSGEITKTSKGKLEGKNMEQIINPRTGLPYFIAKEPKHWLERSIENGEANLVIRVKQALNNFDFSSPKYLRGGVR